MRTPFVIYPFVVYQKAQAKEKKKKDVHHYPGGTEDMPKAIATANKGKVLKSNRVLMVIRAGKKLSDCKKACQDETKIPCRFYRFIDQKKSCLLMTSKWLNKEEKKNGKQRGKKQQKGKKQQQKGKEQQQKGKEQQQKGKKQQQKGEKQQQKGEKQQQKGEKQQKSITDIKKNQKSHDKKLNQIANMLEKVRDGKKETLDKIRKKEKGMEERIRDLVKGEGKMGNVVMELASKLNKVSTDIASMKIANGELKRQLSDSGGSSPFIERKLARLTSSVTELKTRTEMNPTVFKITKNQRILAEALESIDRELTVFQSKLRHIDERTDELGGRQSRGELHRKTINDALQVLTKAVKNMRGNIKKVINPQSSYNIKRTNAMKAVQSELEMLSQRNKKVTYDLSQTRTELSSLLKDIVAIQQTHQKSMASIEILAQSNRNTKQNYKVLKSDQDQMMTKIQTLASVYRSLLTALHNLEIKEINVLHKLERYGEAVSRLNANFLGAVKGNGKGSKKGKQTSRSLINLSNLLKSQKYIYSQVLKLRKELRKVKKRKRGRSKSKGKSRRRKGRRRKKKRKKKGKKKRKKKGKKKRKIKGKKKGKGMLRLDRKMQGIHQLDQRMQKHKKKTKTNKKKSLRKKMKEEGKSRT